MRIQIPASLTKRKLLKGTVDVISNDSLFMEWNFQFTTVPFKPFCDRTKLLIFHCKLTRRRRSNSIDITVTTL